MADSRVKALVGNEQPKTYESVPIESGRWAYGWEIFKKGFTKLILINFFMLITFIPAIAVMYLRLVYLNNYGVLFPFSSNAGLGYPVAPDTVGMQERIYMMIDLCFYALLVVSGIIANFGISGGSYSVKRLINTNGEFKAKDFLHGIKISYLRTLPTVLFGLALVFACVITSDWSTLVSVEGGNLGGVIALQVFTIVFSIVFGLYLLWILTVSGNYKVGLGATLKCSGTFMFATVIQTVIVLAVALLPLWLYLLFANVAFLSMLVILVFIFFGFSFVLYVWNCFAQWTFDAFVQEEPQKIKKENKQANARVEETDPKKIQEEETLALLTMEKSQILASPIKPVDDDVDFNVVDGNYGRQDFSALRSVRDAIKAGVDEYYNLHRNEKDFVEYNKLFADREKALPSTDKKGKKKKLSSNNLLG